jgi:GDP-L-fucose synthase
VGYEQAKRAARRSLDVARAEKEFGFRSRTDFETGVRRTVEWWAQQQAA